MSEVSYTYRSRDGKDISAGPIDSKAFPALREWHASGTEPISSVNGVPEDLTGFLDWQITLTEAEITKLRLRLDSLRKEKLLRKKQLTRYRAAASFKELF